MSMRKDVRTKQTQNTEEKGKPAGEAEVWPALDVQIRQYRGGFLSRCKKASVNFAHTSSHIKYPANVTAAASFLGEL